MPVSFSRSIAPLVYVPQGVLFSGGAYTKRSGAIAAADSKTGLISFWLKNFSDNSAARFIFCSNVVAGSFILQLYVASGGAISVVGKSTGDVTRLAMSTTSIGFASMTAWKHVLISWDLVAARGQIYTNDVDDTAGGSTLSNTDIAYTLANSSTLPALNDGSSNYNNGYLADFQLWTGVNVDLATSANRRAFISAGGVPINPSLAPGILGITLPNVLFYGPASVWDQNKGSAGAFALQAGTITNAANNPP